MVHNRFERDWHSFLACSQKYIVVMIDGRGTGFKGRKLRNPVMDDLGHWEVVDQIAAGREMAKRRYVDTGKIGIWGWVSVASVRSSSSPLDGERVPVHHRRGIVSLRKM